MWKINSLSQLVECCGKKPFPVGFCHGEYTSDNSQSSLFPLPCQSMKTSVSALNQVKLVEFLAVKPMKVCPLPCQGLSLQEFSLPSYPQPASITSSELSFKYFYQLGLLWLLIKGNRSWLWLFGFTHHSRLQDGTL